MAEESSAAPRTSQPCTTPDGVGHGGGVVPLGERLVVDDVVHTGAGGEHLRHGSAAVEYVDRRQEPVGMPEHGHDPEPGQGEELLAVAGAGSVEEPQAKDDPGATGVREPVGARFGGVVAAGHRVVVD